MEKFKKEVLIELRNYLLGVAIEGSKGEDPRSRLFLIPFVFSFLIISFLFIKIFFVW